MNGAAEVSKTVTTIGDHLKPVTTIKSNDMYVDHDILVYRTLASSDALGVNDDIYVGLTAGDQTVECAHLVLRIEESVAVVVTCSDISK